MKLLSYHIENYGKLHNIDGNFSGGLTCFCEKNGFGKSTLASFIKAMFYGLPSYTVASKGFCERQHFYPFEGGKFGGNLTFESEGKIYRVERFFDKKSNKGDECKVYQNGAPFDGFGDEIGKTLFGLDEDSFKKTIFITADEIEISSTHAINEKLNRSAEGVGDGYALAMQALDKTKKTLKAARGNNDKISEKKAEITELIARIKNLQDMSESLAPVYTKREECAQEIAKLETQVESASARNVIAQKWQTLDTMSAQKQMKEKALERLKEKYPLGIPTEKERALLQESLQQSSLLQGSLQAVSLSKEKENALQELEGKFANGAPRVELISSYQQKISRLTALEAEKNRLLNIRQSEKQTLLEKKFSLTIPNERTLQEGRALLEDYKREEQQLKAFSAQLFDTKKQTSPQKSKAKAWLLALGVVLLGAGAGLFFIQQTLGIVLLVLGGVSGVAALVANAMNATLPPSNAHFEMATLQANIKIIEEKLRAITVPYGYYSEAGAAYDFSLLEEDVKAYNAYLKEEEERKSALVYLTQEENALQRETYEFLQRYGAQSENLQNGLNRLTSEISLYQALKADKQTAKERETQAKARLTDAQNAIASLLEKYALTPLVATMDGLKGLELDAKASFDLARDIELLAKELVEYKEKNGLYERPEGEEVSVSALHARLSALRAELANLDKNIVETERFVEKLPDAENALALAEEKLKGYKEKHELISDTMQALKNAEQALKDKYIAPIKERFSIYAEALERVLDEKVSMDPDFRIVFERGGEARNDKHLSAGERSLCGLCLRLALIDNMYETEKPFIVMDDPFVHLDEAHLSRVKALVGELSKDKQIVYFCCHESRRI